MHIEFKASKRDAQGSSASRRLRRAGSVPGIIYGGEKQPQPITLDHNELFHMMKKEAFHASVLNIDVDGSKETVLLRDAQWHAYKPLVLHVDFQRVAADQKIHIKVPLHFINGENSPAVKLSGSMISHVITELDVECLPSNLPEFIEVDLSDLQAEHSLHLSQLTLPEGVSAVHHGDGDPVLVTVLKTRAGSDADDGEAAESN